MSTQFKKNVKKISTLWRARTLLANPGKLISVFRDARTPMIARILPIAALVYVISPIDIIPDFIPVLGQLDDMAVAMYLISIALNHVPDEVFKSVGVDFKKVTDI